eukprot:scaffold198276_cov39-Tisochrysis_lutea.AAC.3
MLERQSRREETPDWPYGDSRHKLGAAGWHTPPERSEPREQRPNSAAVQWKDPTCVEEARRRGHLDRCLWPLSREEVGMQQGANAPGRGASDEYEGGWGVAGKLTKRPERGDNNVVPTKECATK